MITELNKLDHVMLEEKDKQIILLIFDPSDIWVLKEEKSKFSKLFSNRERKEREMDLKHFIYLNKKVENYVQYILNNGLVNNFPEIKDRINEYKYEIRVVTQFEPKKEYIQIIDNINKNLKKITDKRIIVTNEMKNI